MPQPTSFTAFSRCIFFIVWKISLSFKKNYFLFFFTVCRALRMTPQEQIILHQKSCLLFTFVFWLWAHTNEQIECLLLSCCSNRLQWAGSKNSFRRLLAYAIGHPGSESYRSREPGHIIQSCFYSPLSHSLSLWWHCSLPWLKCILPCIHTHKQKAFHGWLNLIVLPPCSKGICFDFDLFSRSDNTPSAVNATRVPLLKVQGWTRSTLALIDLGADCTQIGHKLSRVFFLSH